MAAKYKAIRFDYERAPSLPEKAMVALWSGAERVVEAYEADQSPILAYEMQRAAVAALVAAANSGEFSAADSAALYRAAECFGRRDG